MKYLLSKSQFMRGLQCQKRLWLSRNKKDLAAETTESQQATFDRGHFVGELAQQYFPNGYLINKEHYDVQGSVEETLFAIGNGFEVIYEAQAANEKGIYSRIDILVKSGEKWDLVEVKSSTEVKEEHIHDCAIQRHIFESSGYKIDRSYLMHLSKSYSFKKELDLDKLFELSDITGEVNERIRTLGPDIEECLETLKSKNEIDIEVGSHCDSPYPCDFKEYCWPEVKEDNISFHFPAGKQNKLIVQNIDSILDIDDKTTGLNAKDQILVNSFKNKEIHVNKEGIRNFIDQLEYPIYHLDYETFAPAVPFLESTGCYKPQVPFQFSIHIQESENAKVKHFEFLYEKRGDPRREIAEAVIKSCGDKGTILAYNMSFEKSVNTRLAEQFDDLRDSLLLINERINDLIIPFRNRDLYHWKQCSSASIKMVLPAFCPDLSYKDLDINVGTIASNRYEAFQCGKLNKSDASQLFIDLKKYCHLDTLAMVRLLEVLKSYI